MYCTLADRFFSIRQQIRMAEQEVGRPEGSVSLIAVSKMQPAVRIADAYRYGQRHFGENYLQEALLKQHKLAHFAIVWHFIGPIQANKTKWIAQRFTWVHSVDRLKIAQRLNDQRPITMPPLNVCIQLNLDHEITKRGVDFEQLCHLVQEIAQLPRLRLRGLMAIPPPTENRVEQQSAFRAVRHAYYQLSGYRLDTLSMGMSGDLEPAIAEGATFVRVGTSLFGPRATML